MNEHTSAGAGAAADDGELIRYLDGELNALARARLERLLAADPAAARRLATLRIRGERMSRLLAAADGVGTNGALSSALPALRHERRYLLRAATVVLALAAAALLAPPVRAFIAERFQQLVTNGAPDARPESAAPAPTLPAPGEAFRTRFPVAGEDFRIDIATSQAVGKLTLRGDAGGGMGSAAIAGSAGQVELLVADGVLRILNVAGDVASYTVTLPPSVRRVHVRIGDGLARTVLLAGRTGSTIDLTVR